MRARTLQKLSGFVRGVGTGAVLTTSLQIGTFAVTEMHLPTEAFAADAAVLIGAGLTDIIIGVVRARSGDLPRASLSPVQKAMRRASGLMVASSIGLGFAAGALAVTSTRQNGPPTILAPDIRLSVPDQLTGATCELRYDKKPTSMQPRYQ